MFSFIRIVAVFTITLPYTIQQQFFEESYRTCEFENAADKKTITVPNQVWNVQGLNRHKDVLIKLSICDLGSSIPDCDVGATVCTVNKKKNRYIIKNAGTSFIYTKDDTEANIFKSINGEFCDGEERFTTIIEFSRYPDISLEPKFKFMSECELKIEIPDPEYEPPCTLKKNGHFIDMRSLKNIETIVEHPEPKMKFSLNVCKKSPKCDPDVSICQLLDDGRSTAISDVSSQRLLLKEGSLLIQGHTNEYRRFRLEFRLNLKCNWKATGLTNLVYVKPQQKGKRYSFSAESSVACVKLPINCLIRDPANDNFLYDLRRLYRGGNGWNVKNVTGGRIDISMCGPLRFSDSTTECAKQHSQVCLMKGGAINLGSIQKNIQVTAHDTVITSFTDGSACFVNGTERSYSTEIEFICKIQEDGPIVHDIIDECVYKIKWYTPIACAKNLPIGDDCRVTDMTGPINLNPMRQYQDRTHTLSPNSFLRFNLCGPLNKRCNNHTAAVCLVNGNTEHVLGRTNLTLVKNNEIISTIMKGDKCSGKMSELKINFRCNQFATPGGQVQVKIIRDFCDYEITVNTPTACSPMSFFDCKLYNGNWLYDLSPLMRHDANYEIKQAGLLYSLNLCRSVVRTNNAQCTAYAGICMKNLTEMHEKKSYISLGMINSDIDLKLDGADVVVEYKHGTLCPDDFSDRSSLIRFKCSTLEEGPKLLRKTACNHEFVWRTPEACGKNRTNPKMRSPPACIFADPVTKNTFDLAAINTIIKFERHNETFKVPICSNAFTYCTLNNGLNCTTLDTDFQLASSSNGPSILYSLFNRSCTDNIVNFVNISVSCEPTYSINKFEVGEITNCTQYADLKTQHVCSKDLILKSNEIISSKPEIVSQTENQDCTIPELNHFSLNSLGNLKIFSMSNNSLYVFNFDRKGDCNGLVCKDGLSMGPEVHLCPLTKIDDVESSVRLIYRSRMCLDDFFRSEILLKCDENSVPRIVKETDCSVVVHYPFKEVCTWFPQSGQLEVSSADSTGVAVGSSVGVLVLLALVGGGIIVFKKRERRTVSRI
ncbi:cation-independent mannose-6-phosphate receptor-like isoform X2 [Photinus pyralis]|uniref:cation-independent mannose-6-phosphate receptor-like isoform X2 n=1 Tax=Photinus pyralis TaxID=7054 RepID=UPI001266EE90|nr:cation-independent mannose-6-phosphate receptor-like isoform X2 [Photinus pyralis]